MLQLYIHALPMVTNKKISIGYIQKEMRRELKHVTMKTQLNTKQDSKGINDLTITKTTKKSYKS